MSPLLQAAVDPDLAQARAVGVGALAVTCDPAIVLAAHALGSCVAVCIWDAETRVAGLLHFLLPDSRKHVERARLQPATFADTGIPLLFETAYRHGLKKARAVVHLVGGLEVAESSVTRLRIGRRNLLAARRLLSSNGVAIEHELTGGLQPRSVFLSSATGRVHVKTGREHIVLNEPPHEY